VWFSVLLLARDRADNLRREAGKDWVRESWPRAESSTHGTTSIAAFGVIRRVMLWDFLRATPNSPSCQPRAVLPTGLALLAR
jgi:hypothetical protein